MHTEREQINVSLEFSTTLSEPKRSCKRRTGPLTTQGTVKTLTFVEKPTQNKMVATGLVENMKSVLSSSHGTET